MWLELYIRIEEYGVSFYDYDKNYTKKAIAFLKQKKFKIKEMRTINNLGVHDNIFIEKLKDVLEVEYHLRKLFGIDENTDDIIIHVTDGVLEIVLRKEHIRGLKDV